MTDNEIIKALPFIAKYCKREYNDIRVDELLLGALDLINRQKSEIERLRYNLEAVLDERADHSEAIKEFAELSIKRICEEVSAPTPSESYIVEKCNQTIDNLLKELVENENEKI